MKNTNKKLIAVTASIATLLSTAAMINAEEGGKIYLNESILENASIQNKDDITLIPLRAVCESLGFTVTWIEESRTIELVKLPIYITCSPDRDGYTFSKMAPQELGIAPLLIDDTTYVPKSFVNEILKGSIEEKNGNYYISYGENSQTSSVAEGTVCDLIYEDDKLVQIIIGDTEDIDSQIALNLSEELAQSAIEQNIVIGSYVTAETTELQTMSIPPQMIPTSITVINQSPSLFGTVCDLIYEDDKLVQIVIGDADDINSQTVLNLSEDIALRAEELGIVIGSEISAQITDLMTMSIPPQVIPTSLEIVETQNPVISGAVCDLIYEDEKLIQIVIGDIEDPNSQTILNLSEDMAKTAEELDIVIGSEISAQVTDLMTMSIPPQMIPVSIELSQAQEADSVEIEGKICELVYENDKLVQIVIGNEDDRMSQTALNLSDELSAKAVELNAEKGMTIRGTASAMTTRSLPPQQALLSIDEIK